MQRYSFKKEKYVQIYSDINRDADHSIGFSCRVRHQWSLRRRLSSLPISNGIIPDDNTTNEQL